MQGGGKNKRTVPAQPFAPGRYHRHEHIAEETKRPNDIDPQDKPLTFHQKKQPYETKKTL